MLCELVSVNDRHVEIERRIMMKTNLTKLSRKIANQECLKGASCLIKGHYYEFKSGSIDEVEETIDHDFNTDEYRLFHDGIYWVVADHLTA